MEDIENLKIDKEFLYKKGFCGLNNLGNTCFMNSIIQCLSNTIPLLKYMFTKEFDETINKSRDGYKLIKELKITMKNLWHKNSVFSPNDFFRELQMLSMKKNRIEFTGFGQNDSQEFLQFILEILHEVLSTEINIEIEGTEQNDFDKFMLEAYKSYKKFFENDYSQIIEIFYGQYFTQLEIITDEKHEKNSSFEPFNMVSLDIVPGSSNLYDCLDQFVKPELIINDGSQKIKKEVSFWDLPDILIIYLKRYDNNLEKIDSLIDFPVEHLNMSPYVNGYEREKYKYELYAISNHQGGMGGGHYWSYIKNIDNNWYKFNDNIVSTISRDKIVSEEAYCLFYVKKS